MSMYVCILVSMLLLLILWVFIYPYLKAYWTHMRLNSLYKTIPSYSISKEYRKINDPSNPDYIYGEIYIYDLLKTIYKITQNKQCCFLDLGCGDGKLVLAVAYNFSNISCIGVDVVTKFIDVAKKQYCVLKKRIQHQQSDVKFKVEDFLKTGLNSSNLIYCNAGACKIQTWNQLCLRFETLAPGTLLLSVSQKIDSRHFSLLKIVSVRASWGRAKLHIYLKKS